MNWFNYYGLAIIVIIMIPNIIFAVKQKDGYKNIYKNRVVEILEQIGRYACLILMIFNIPYTYFNFWFGNALVVYLSINSSLCLAYVVFWGASYKKKGKFKALSLSIIPSFIFLFSGIMLANIPLIVFALLFGVNHIMLSYKNAAININF